MSKILNSAIPITLSVVVDDLSPLQPRPTPCGYTPTLMERLPHLGSSLRSPLPKGEEANEKNTDQSSNACANFAIPKLYGISNCSTVKKARDWLAQHNIEVEFHDFKKQGLNEEIANNWLKQRDWNELVNRKGLTWRGLTDEQKQRVKDNSSALCLMMEKSSVIKRPLLEQDGLLLHVGFDAAAYAEIFNIEVPT